MDVVTATKGVLETIALQTKGMRSALVRIS